MKNRSCDLLILAVFLLILTNTLNLTPLGMSEDKNAYFASATFNAKIRAEQPDTWIFTVHNMDRAESDEGEARFFFRFYMDGELWWDEYNSTNYRTWLCKRGHNATRGYNIKGWNVLTPVAHDIKVDLYWVQNGTFHLEDTTSFSIAVTMLMPMRHIYASSYLAAYLILSFILISYYYITELELEETRVRALD